MATAKKRPQSPRELILADKRWMRPLRIHSPSHWFKKCSALPDKSVRIHAACIIWWDFVATRTKPTRSTKMEQFLNSWRYAGTPDHAALTAALVSLGYPEDAAKARLTISQAIGCLPAIHRANKRRTD